LSRFLCACNANFAELRSFRESDKLIIDYTVGFLPRQPSRNSIQDLVRTIRRSIAITQERRWQLRRKLSRRRTNWASPNNGRVAQKGKHRHQISLSARRRTSTATRSSTRARRNWIKRTSRQLTCSIWISLLGRRGITLIRSLLHAMTWRARDSYSYFSILVSRRDFHREISLFLSFLPSLAFICEIAAGISSALSFTRVTAPPQWNLMHKCVRARVVVWKLNLSAISSLHPQVSNFAGNTDICVMNTASHTAFYMRVWLNRELGLLTNLEHPQVGIRQELIITKPRKIFASSASRAPWQRTEEGGGMLIKAESLFWRGSFEFNTYPLIEGLLFMRRWSDIPTLTIYKLPNYLLSSSRWREEGIRRRLCFVLITLIFSNLRFIDKTLYFFLKQSKLLQLTTWMKNIAQSTEKFTTDKICMFYASCKVNKLSSVIFPKPNIT